MSPNDHLKPPEPSPTTGRRGSFFRRSSSSSSLNKAYGDSEGEKKGGGDGMGLERFETARQGPGDGGVYDGRVHYQEQQDRKSPKPTIHTGTATVASSPSPALEKEKGGVRKRAKSLGGKSLAAEEKKSMGDGGGVPPMPPKREELGEILLQGYMLKKKKKKMQGFAKRYFWLSKEGILSYAFTPTSPIRQSLIVSQSTVTVVVSSTPSSSTLQPPPPISPTSPSPHRVTSQSNHHLRHGGPPGPSSVSTTTPNTTSSRTRQIHIDSGSTGVGVWHLRCLTESDFNQWVRILKTFVRKWEFGAGGESVGGPGGGGATNEEEESSPGSSGSGRLGHQRKKSSVAWGVPLPSGVMPGTGGAGNVALSTGGMAEMETLTGVAKVMKEMDSTIKHLDSLRTQFRRQESLLAPSRPSQSSPPLPDHHPTPTPAHGGGKLAKIFKKGTRDDRGTPSPLRAPGPTSPPNGTSNDYFNPSAPSSDPSPQASASHHQHTNSAGPTTSSASITSSSSNNTASASVFFALSEQTYQDLGASLNNLQKQQSALQGLLGQIQVQLPVATPPSPSSPPSPPTSTTAAGNNPQHPSPGANLSSLAEASRTTLSGLPLQQSPTRQSFSVDTPGIISPPGSPRSKPLSSSPATVPIPLLGFPHLPHIPNPLALPGMPPMPNFPNPLGVASYLPGLMMGTLGMSGIGPDGHSGAASPGARSRMSFESDTTIGGYHDADEDGGDYIVVNEDEEDRKDEGVPSTLAPTTLTRTTSSTSLNEEAEGSDEDEDEDPATEMETRPGAIRINSRGNKGREAGSPRREQLPCPAGPELSLGAVLRKAIGKDLTKMTMPVTANEPLSALQRIAEEMDYSELLERAVKVGAGNDEEPRIMWVAAFACSGYGSTVYRGSRKPFNPLLGETYELVDSERNFRLVSEKVSHHPPIMAAHAEGEGWVFEATSGIHQKFWGRSLEFTPDGSTRIRFLDDGSVYSWTRPSTWVEQLMSPEKKINHKGKLIVKREDVTDSGERATITFDAAERSTFGSLKNPGDTDRMLKGEVRNAKGKMVAELRGRWDQTLVRMRAKDEFQVLWTCRQFPSECKAFYGFSRFAIGLNELVPGDEHILPPTDSRLRPDQRLFEQGDIEGAESKKQELEEKQRAKRAPLTPGGPPQEQPKPTFFVEKGKDYVFKGETGYWERRKKHDWKDLPEVF